MSLVKTACRVIERIAPLRLAEKWDNVGLLLEAPFQRDNANRVLLTIDLTPPVLQEALSTPTSLIISYHPTIFKPLSSLTLTNSLQSSLLRCAAAGISIYSPHTALDSVYGGINDWLAEGLGSGTAKALEEKDETGGAGRIVKLDQDVDFDELVKRVRTHLGLSRIQVAHPHTRSTSSVRSVAICAGSGGSMLLGVDADVYFTGEMSHHEVLAAIASGKYVILCGHTNTERGYLPRLASKLQVGFNHAKSIDGEGVPEDVEIVISQADRHPLDIV